MGDLFNNKGIRPMLIRDQKPAFDSPDYIYELKLDGIRCIGYLSSEETDLRNKRNITLLPRFPELSHIHKQVKEKCILDGELIHTDKNGKPNFYELQRRTILADKFKIDLAAKKFPTTYIVYDILYYKDRDITDLPLIDRKRLLADVLEENQSIAESRYIEEYGTKLYELVEAEKLEGIVAKKKSSMYFFDKRSKDWIKCKRIHDIDLIICGYVLKRPMNVIILGGYKNGRLTYCGSVSFGVNLSFLKEYGYKRIPYSPFTLKTEDKVESETGVIWIEPNLVCTVEYMPNTEGILRLRQGVFKGIREDKSPEECMI